MKIRAIIFIFVGSCLAYEMPDKAVLGEKHIFVLIASSEDDINHVEASFEVENLIKSNFPVGPLRYNKVSNFKSINEQQLEEIKNNSWELPLLCVEDLHGKTVTKCGFESLEHNHLAYVFTLPDGMKDIKGYIILRTLYNSIVKKFDVKGLATEDYSDEEEFWEEEPNALEKKEPANIFEKIYLAAAHNATIQKTTIWILLKYFEIKNWLINYV